MQFSLNAELAKWQREVADLRVHGTRYERPLDRLLHHSVTINIKGDSYRLKVKLKVGLMTRFCEQNLKF